LEHFKTALKADNVDEVLSCFVGRAAEQYAGIIELLRPYFSQMVDDIAGVVPISNDGNSARYDLLRDESGQLYGYPISFIKDENGNWKISDF